MLREARSDTVTLLAQRPAPSLVKTMEAMRTLRGRTGAAASPLERELKLVSSLGPAKR